MEGSEEESKWGRSPSSRGFNLNAPYIPSSPSFAPPLPGSTPGTSSSRHAETGNAARDEVGIRQNRERLDLWGDLPNPAPPPGRSAGKNGGGDVSLREWLDRLERAVELVECLHIFRQVVNMVSIAHAHGVVVNNVRPSCLVMSTMNQVSFIESASCSTSGSGSGADSCEERGRENSARSDFVRGTDLSCGGSRMEEGDWEEFRKRTAREVSERKRAFPLKQILMMETNWYMSPEEVTGGTSSFASDVYRLGVLLFELVCASTSAEEKLKTMSNLRHRVMPPHLLLKWPKEASFCLWLLHPLPSTRPKMSEILKSDFLTGPKDSLEEREEATKLREEIEDQELLVDFLVHLRERKQETANRLHDVICCLSSDIEEVMKKQTDFKENVVSFSKLDKDEHSELETADLSPCCPERVEESVISCSRKRSRSEHHAYSEVKSSEPLPGGTGSDMQSNVKERISSKSSRLMKNFKKLESAYFLTRCRATKPAEKNRSRCMPAGSTGRGSVVRTEGSSVDNFVPKESLTSGRKGEWINPFLEGLCKYLGFSKLNVRGDLKQGDLLSSSNLVCSLVFDRDKEFFATAGVNRKIKVFDYEAISREHHDIHYPVVEMSSRSKFSSICWNSYIKSQIASSDFDGVVQVWDITRSEVILEMKEHEKRVWSVDFSLADPMKLASGSDDGTVKLWNINQLGNIGTIKTKANVCSVQFQPDSGRSIAIGSADHRIYCFDLRNLRVPWCTLSGHSKTVSYVKFVDSTTLVSASTDNTIKLWDLSSCASTVLNSPVQTFTGHTNIKNFVGLSVSDGYIATGSETNEVFVYHKAFPMPMLSFKFDQMDNVSGRADDMAQFVSCVSWRGKSNSLVAANSSGNIKLLEMV